MTRILTALVLLATACPAAAADYQKLADDTKWEWKHENASVLRSVQNYHGDLQVEIAKRANTFGKLTVRFSKGDTTVLALDGHHATGFAADGNVLYYTEYHPSASGCAVVAFDMAAGKELWKSYLKGIGPIAHTAYRNLVAVELHGGALRVLGHESAGDYVEYVDLKTGKTVGHKLFRKGFEE